MNVKIDTKEKFSVIIPEESTLSANMSEKFQELLQSYLQKTIPHVILNLKHSEQIDEKTVVMILTVQNQFYANNCSFVICEINEKIKPLFEESVNITPTESEAWDIVQMEEIERELMKDFE